MVDRTDNGHRYVSLENHVAMPQFRCKLCKNTTTVPSTSPRCPR